MTGESGDPTPSGATPAVDPSPGTLPTDEGKPESPRKGRKPTRVQALPADTAEAPRNDAQPPTARNRAQPKKRNITAEHEARMRFVHKYGEKIAPALDLAANSLMLRGLNAQAKARNVECNYSVMRDGGEMFCGLLLTTDDKGDQSFDAVFLSLPEAACYFAHAAGARTLQMLTEWLFDHPITMGVIGAIATGTALGFSVVGYGKDVQARIDVHDANAKRAAEANAAQGESIRVTPQ